ncbi:helix-turn-helix transcriptional regulator [Streptomyces violaceoruber]|uniref:LuxR C-terminal-related transcriptional regulator n=1 Tax=Streptomyces violaceoruber TaxID=1935 RepID=UPI001F1E837E|nr:LuxR C-terminal-related transcriptional regulator [Streptomyces violaceoruber]MCF3165779.1 helix-turn-helix transcriptional regulator [Streptomyces violaceoruber]
MIDDRMFVLYSALLDRSPATPDDLARAFPWSRPVTAAALERLLSLKLVRRLPAGRGYVPNRPDAAAAQAINALDSRVRVLQREAERIRRELKPLMPSYLAAAEQVQRADPVDLLPSQDRVDAVLDEAAALCQSQMLAVRADDPTAREDPERSLARDQALLDRGVTVRVLGPPQGPASDRTARIAATGAELRAVRDVTARFVVFDDDVALILRNGEQAGPVGIVVRDTDLVTFLNDLFAHLWQGGTELPGERRHIAQPELTNATKRRILRLLVQGHRDEAIARRLSISVRTCRRHIAEIMEMSGAASRFQAGYLLAGRHLLDAVD